MRRAARLGLIGLSVLVAPLGMVAQVPQAPATPEIHLQRADAFFAEGRYREAREAYREALAAGDRRTATSAATGLVLSLLRVADFLAAAEEAQQFREARPDDPALAALHGEALWALGVFAGAEATFEAALAADPAQPRARHGRARSLGAQNRLAEAVADARDAIRLDPKAADFHHTLGYLYERMGRLEDAIDAYSRYVERLPNRDRSDQVAAMRLRIRFLQSFRNRRPMEIQGGAGNQIWRIPITITEDKVLVRARINKGTYDVVLDTGAEQTVVSREVARRERIAPASYVRAAGVGESGVRGLQVGRIDELQIGDLTIRNVPCLIKNPPLGGTLGQEPSALSPLALGLSMRIDYASRQLVLARTLPPAPHTHSLPLRMHRLALVGGTLNERLPAAFAVDTGGEVITISHEAAGLIGSDARFRRIPLRVFGTSGWDKEAFLMPAVDLEFDTLRFSSIPVVVLDLRAPSALLGFKLGGTLGHQFLSRYRVSIDLVRSVLELEP